MEKYKNIKSFDELIDLEHGKIGTSSRNKYEENAQRFIVSEIQKEEIKNFKNQKKRLIKYQPFLILNLIVKSLSETQLFR